MDEKYVLKVPENLDPAGAAPLVWAGITPWAALKNWNVGTGDTVGIIGLGGLGHMVVTLAKALGAYEVLISAAPETLMQNMNRFDFLLNTVPVRHDINPYLPYLKAEGMMVVVGTAEPLAEGVNCQLVVGRGMTVAGSLIGSLKKTQELLDFCGEHSLVADIEIIKVHDINRAYERIHKNDIKYRFVIDIASL